MKSKKFPKPISQDNDRYVLHNHSSLYSMTFKSLINFIKYANNNYVIPEGYKEAQVQFTQEGVDIYSIRTESQLIEYREEKEKEEYERLRDIFEPKPENTQVPDGKVCNAVVSSVNEKSGLFSKLFKQFFGKKKIK